MSLFDRMSISDQIRNIAVETRTSERAVREMFNTFNLHLDAGQSMARTAEFFRSRAARLRGSGGMHP